MYVQKYGISSVTFENTSQHFILGILPSVVLIECLLLLQMLYHKLAHTVEKTCSYNTFFYSYCIKNTVVVNSSGQLCCNIQHTPFTEIQTNLVSLHSTEVTEFSIISFTPRKHLSINS